ncbi:MAG: tail fiber domain-containing protein [Parafilimonas sp.]
MKKILSLTVLIFCCIVLHAQNANTTLSNLTKPVQVNQDLLPKSNNKKNLGSAAASWRNIYADSTFYLNDVPFIANKNNNVFIGQSAAINNTTGDANAALGNRAMYNITTGSNNTALGHRALYSNKIGFNNVAIGPFALYHSTSKNNHAIGYEALYENTTGASNIAIGYKTLTRNTTGSSNIGIGEEALFSNTTGSNLVAIGDSSLSSNTTGTLNTAIGNKSLSSNTSGGHNTATGANALSNNTSGSFNTANGLFSLALNTIGNNNTAYGSNTMESNKSGNENNAIGLGALRLNTTGSSNLAIGNNALYNNTSGKFNIAIGTQALFNKITNSNNTAIGYQALYNFNSNSSFTYNTAIGYQAMFNTTSGNYNSAIGYEALYNNIGGVENTANGRRALYSNTNGSENTAVGMSALYNSITGSRNVGVGFAAGTDHTSDSVCTFLGAFAGYTSYITDPLVNSMCLGSFTLNTQSNQISIGNTAITSIRGQVNFGTYSDGRYKKEVKENIPGLKFINKLKPVTYKIDATGVSKFIGEGGNDETENASINAKNSLMDRQRKEKEKITYTGFIAQEVEKAAKEIDYDFSGVEVPKNEHDLYALRYAEFVVPLVKAVQELDAENTQLKSTLSDVLAQLADIKNQLNDVKTNQQQCCPNNINNSQNNNAQTSNFAQAALEQNAPNPFSNTTIIRFYIPSDIKQASLIITNTNGQLLKSISLNERGSGQTSVLANTLAAGNYFYSLIIDGKRTGTKQMTLTK